MQQHCFDEFIRILVWLLLISAVFVAIVNRPEGIVVLAAIAGVLEDNSLFTTAPMANRTCTSEVWIALTLSTWTQT